MSYYDMIAIELKILYVETISQTEFLCHNVM